MDSTENKKVTLPEVEVKLDSKVEEVQVGGAEIVVKSQEGITTDVKVSEKDVTPQIRMGGNRAERRRAEAIMRKSNRNGRGQRRA